MSAGLACVLDEPPMSEYEQGVRDGIESTLRKIKSVRFNPSSMHLHAPTAIHATETGFIRMDHLDEVIAECTVAP